MIPHDTSMETRQCFMSVAVVLTFGFERKWRRKLVILELMSLKSMAHEFSIFEM